MKQIKILVFTEGTLIKHKKDIDDFRSYVPVVGCVDKLKLWKLQGANICYLTSRKTKKEIEDVRFVLTKYGFPNSQELFFRKNGEQYKDVAEGIMPDILIEDDCASIGGKWQMTYPHINRDLKKKIKSIVVKEFSGIDTLPDDASKLG
ncbi:MAG: hypothetical protein AAB954_01480 [Patescibacteria group bacterium]